MLVDPKSVIKLQTSLSFLHIWDLCIKAECKTLMKLSPGVNFINVIHTSFILVDPKIEKKIDNLTVIFTQLGSACIKAVCKMLMKLSLDKSLRPYTHNRVALKTSLKPA